ncbi:MAG: cyclic nucleotide-binding domain-containing protein [Deltaproteobacteria bacterium]|nr:cyclic nucleotide-binding domain-containing protein [Deltaproteobacteria bacterium]
MNAKRLVKEYERALKAEPDNLVIRLKLAAALREVGRTNDALSMYRSVAVAYRAQGRLAQAAAVVRSVLELEPAHSEMKILLSELDAAQVARTTAARGEEDKGPAESPGRIGISLPLVASALERRESSAPRTPGAPPRAPTYPTGTPTGIAREPTETRTRLPLPAPDDDEPSWTDAVPAIGSGVLSPFLSPANREKVLVRGTSNREDETERFEDETLTLPAYSPRTNEATSPGMDFDKDATPGRGSSFVRDFLPIDPFADTREGVEPTGPGWPASGPMEEEESGTLFDSWPGDSASESHDAGDAGALDMLVPATDVPPQAVVLARAAEATLSTISPDATDRVARITLPRVKPFTNDETKDGEEGGPWDGHAATFAPVLERLAPDGSAIEPLRSPFAALPREVVRELKERMWQRDFRSGDLILREGEIGDSCFLIRSGSVRVLKLDPACSIGSPSAQIEIARLGPGAVLGELALLADSRRHATVEATEDVRLYEIPRHLLVEMAGRFPGLRSPLERLCRERLIAGLLATAPLFRPLPEDERARLMARFIPMCMEAGQPIIRQDEPAEGLYLIVLGAVDVTRVLDQGQSVHLASLREGSYFGEISLLSGGLARATVATTTMSELAFLPRHDFYAVLSEYPAIWQELRDEADRREKLNEEFITRLFFG